MKLLYKYMSNPEYLIKEGYIRATQLAALNDPFEGTYCRNSLKDLCHHFEVFESPEDLVSYVDTKMNEIGVISLTEAKDNLLMWSHYADNHKGAVIGIWTSSALGGNMFAHLHEPQLDTTCFLDSSYSMFKGECSPVLYRKQPRYRVDQFDFDYSNISAEGEDRILYEIFQQKSDEWIYEKEHRTTLRLDQADKIVVKDVHRLKNKHVLGNLLRSEFSDENNDGEFNIYLDKISDKIEREVFAKNLVELSKDPSSLYLFKLCPGSMKSIIYGLNFNADNIENYQNHLIKHGIFEQWKATLNEDFYTLNFTELQKN